MCRSKCYLRAWSAWSPGPLPLLLPSSRGPGQRAPNSVGKLISMSEWYSGFLPTSTPLNQFIPVEAHDHCRLADYFPLLSNRHAGQKLVDLLKQFLVDLANWLLLPMFQ